MIAGLMLVMMVRNEAGRVERALASVRPVAERWLVIDTGSTDDTINRIHAATAGWDGMLLERPWVDFATNRTQLVQLGAQQGAQWLLILDADHELISHAHLAPLLASTRADALQLPYAGDGPQRWVSRILRCAPRLPWRYDGVGGIHEYLACSKPFSVLRANNPQVVDHADGASRSVKWGRDVTVLLDQISHDPGNARSWFYLGETYRGLQVLPRAIEAYQQCARLCNGEQAYAALLYAGVLLHSLNRHDEAIDVLLEANNRRPERLEALLELCQVHNDLGEHDQVLALLGDGDLRAPLPAADVEGVYPPAYSTDLAKQRDHARAKLQHRAGHR